MKPQPLVSVLMPVYNGQNYLRHSIPAILRQTYTNFEFIIVNDGSTDKTANILINYARRDRRLKLLIHKTNQKISASLNWGLTLARGKYIVRMDADDWCYPDRIEKQVLYMENHPDIVISGGSIEICDQNFNTLAVRYYQPQDLAIRQRLFLYSPFCHAATIYRTQTARKAGGYDPDLSDAEDYDFYFRMGRLGRFGNLPDLIYRMRVNTSGICFRRARRQEWLTLFTRLKAVLVYGYPMTLRDGVYTFAQMLSTYLVPPRLKYAIFNLIRNRWSFSLDRKKAGFSPEFPFWGPIAYIKIFLAHRFQAHLTLPTKK